MKIDDHHAVEVDELTVVIKRDGLAWLAQGLEIDYAASGSSIEDVKQRFERGFSQTIRAHIDRFGNIEHLLEFAPKAVWHRFAKEADRFQFTNKTVHLCARSECPSVPSILRFAEPLETVAG